MPELLPDLIADVTLYATAEGGRKGPLRGDLHDWFGCPCKLQKDDIAAWDGRFLIKGLVISPGDRRRLGVIFLSRTQTVPAFIKAERFYLREGRIIGEAVIVDPLHNSCRLCENSG